MKSRGLSDLSGTYKTLNHNFVGTYHYTRDSADEIKDLLSYAATHTIEFYHVRFNKPALKIILDAINSSKITQVCFYHCNFQGQDIKAKVESLVYIPPNIPERSCLFERRNSYIRDVKIDEKPIQLEGLRVNRLIAEFHITPYTKGETNDFDQKLKKLLSIRNLSKDEIKKLDNTSTPSQYYYDHPVTDLPKKEEKDKSHQKPNKQANIKATLSIATQTDDEGLDEKERAFKQFLLLWDQKLYPPPSSVSQETCVNLILTLCLSNQEKSIDDAKQALALIYACIYQPEYQKEREYFINMMEFVFNRRKSQDVVKSSILLYLSDETNYQNMKNRLCDLILIDHYRLKNAEQGKLIDELEKKLSEFQGRAITPKKAINFYQLFQPFDIAITLEPLLLSNKKTQP